MTSEFLVVKTADASHTAKRRQLMRSIVDIWRRLSFAFKAVILAAALAAPLTMFIGRVSTEEVVEHWSQYFGPWPFGALDWLVNVVLIALVLVSLERIRRWIVDQVKKRDAPTHSRETLYRLLDDVSIGSRGADEFERQNFVKTLSRTIVLPQDANSLVLALESPWGSGKSSVLDLLCRELIRHPDKPLLVRFNPWLATGQERIFRAFFSQFSASLLDEGEKSLAIGLVNFGEALEDLLPAGARVFPRVGFYRLRRLIGRIPIIDLEGERERLRQTVRQVGRPIVVVIDDIDRLAPEDIRVIFQLVKAVAAFPRVAYLLAFDPEPIDRALSFGGSPENGRQFRDKIVQANLALPRIRYRIRKQYFASKLTERLDAWQFSLDHGEQRLLDRAIPLVLSALRTPRDMKRVLNKTLITADNVRKEVNFADILVFEALHAKFPEIVENIRRNPRVVDPAGYGDEEISGSVIAQIVRQEMEEKKDTSAKLNEFLDLYPNHREVLTSLLTFAFPTTFDDSPDPDDDDLVGDRRIAIHENLLKLLYQGLHGEILSAQEAETFLSDAASRGAFLADALEARSLSAWLAHIRPFIQSVKVAAPASLMHELALSVNALYDQARIDATDEARWLLLEILKVIPDNKRALALEQIVGDPRTASVGEELLTSLLQGAGMWNNGEYFGVNAIRSPGRREFASPTPDELNRLRELWLTTVRGVGIRKLIMGYPNAGGVLFRWGQLSESPYSEVAKELDNALDATDFALAFLGVFPPGVSLSGIEKFVSAASWKKLREMLETAKIPDSIKNKFYEYFADLHLGQENPSDSSSDT